MRFPKWIEALELQVKTFQDGQITAGELARVVILLSHDKDLVKNASDNLFAEILHGR